MSQNTISLAAFGAIGASAAAGPLTQVFSELGLLMAIMGALGGALPYLRKYRPPPSRWLGRVVLSAISGAMLAFGLGVLAPPILGGWLGFDLSGSTFQAQGLSACAFLVGLVQDRLMSSLHTAEKADE